MMRITTINNDVRSTTLKIEGRVGGPWADELRRVFNETRRATPDTLVIDLTAVTFIDDSGKHVLKQIYGCGCELVAAGSYNRSVIDEIKDSR
jgi:anti-anti-sigma regulatory factor